MKLQFGDITIEADTIDDIKCLLSFVPANRTTTQARGRGTALPSDRASAPEAREAIDYAALYLSHHPECQRFRVTMEEKESGLDRNTAAMERLISEGIIERPSATNESEEGQEQEIEGDDNDEQVFFE